MSVAFWGNSSVFTSPSNGLVTEMSTLWLVGQDTRATEGFEQVSPWADQNPAVHDIRA
jgi:hypothetical protein